MILNVRSINSQKARFRGQEFGGLGALTNLTLESP